MVEKTLARWQIAINNWELWNKSINVNKRIRELEAEKITGNRV